MDRAQSVRVLIRSIKNPNATQHRIDSSRGWRHLLFPLFFFSYSLLYNYIKKYNKQCFVLLHFPHCFPISVDPTFTKNNFSVCLFVFDLPNPTKTGKKKRNSHGPHAWVALIAKRFANSVPVTNLRWRRWKATPCQRQWHRKRVPKPSESKPTVRLKLWAKTRFFLFSFKNLSLMATGSRGVRQTKNLKFSFIFSDFCLVYFLSLVFWMDFNRLCMCVVHSHTKKEPRQASLLSLSKSCFPPL